ncbi:MAG: ECF transporter S component [Negativicutes bacterium]|nr:ECF transporter S component [Negativicutes bacterium]
MRMQLTFAATGVMMNVVASYLAEMLKIPLLFLDTLGTMLVAAGGGIGLGVLTGIATSTLQAILFNPRDFPFVIVNVAVAVIIGGAARWLGFGYPVALASGLVTAIICPLVGTPVAVWLYGGLTGGGTDFLYLWLRTSEMSVFEAAFWPRVAANLVDKLVSAMVAAYLLKRLPPPLSGRREERR